MRPRLLAVLQTPNCLWVEFTKTFDTLMHLAVCSSEHRFAFRNRFSTNGLILGILFLRSKNKRR